MVSIIAQGSLLSACERKNPILNSGCATSVAKYFKDGAVAEYKVLYSADPKDSAVRLTYTKNYTNIFQEKISILKEAELLPTVSFPVINNIRHYALQCGRNVYINSIASGLEQQINNENIYIKGDRKIGDTWNHTLNGQKYFMGYAGKVPAFITPLDTFVADKIYLKSKEVVAIADTIYYNDTMGVLYYDGPYFKYILNKTNF